MKSLNNSKPPIITLFLLVMLYTLASAGNSFIIGDLRVDLPEVYNALDYRTHIAAGTLPTTGDRRDFSTAWLGVFLDDFTGITGSGKFVQVGIVTTKDGIQWFVYSEPAITCLLGTKLPNYSECDGDYGDIVSLGTYARVELKKDPNENFWKAIVYDSNDVGYVVAQIHDNSNRIYMARVDTEEGYYENTDPFIMVDYYHWHPQYLNGNIWVDWPVSTGEDGNNTLRASPLSICPTNYGVTPNMYGNEYAWRAGVGGVVCEWLLFPSDHNYLPLINY